MQEWVVWVIWKEAGSVVALQLRTQNLKQELFCDKLAGKLQGKHTWLVKPGESPTK